MAMLVAVVMMLGIVMLAGTAYAHTESIHEGMSLEPTPQNRPPVPDVITWKISEKSPEPRDMERIISIIEKSFDMWAKLNPELNFKQVEEDEDILVSMIFGGSGLGLAAPKPDYKGLIVLVFGKYDCRGEHNEYVSDSLTNVMLHELGHILGLGHHKDPEHLMRGTHPPPEDGPFETLGFNIPDRPPIENYGDLMGLKEIHARYHVLNADINSLYPNIDHELNKRVDALEDAIDCMYGTLPKGYGTLDQRVALLYDDVAILDAKLTSIQTTLNTLNTSIDAILGRLTALETDTLPTPEPTPPTPEPEPTPPPTPEPELTIGILEGKIYSDTNNNDILDAGESGIPNRIILLTNYNDWTEILQITTDSNGDYFIELPAGSTWLVQVGGTGIFDYTTVQSGFTTVVNLGLYP